MCDHCGPIMCLCKDTPYQAEREPSAVQQELLALWRGAHDVLRATARAWAKMGFGELPKPPRPGWESPQSSICTECKEQGTLEALFDGDGWALGWGCECGHLWDDDALRPDWPFGKHETARPIDLEALGFHIV
jgi:hypothetical protein